MPCIVQCLGLGVVAMACRMDERLHEYVTDLGIASRVGVGYVVFCGVGCEGMI